MTIKELYEQACLRGYENAEVGINVIDFDNENEPDGFYYTEVVKPTDLEFGHLYDTCTAEKICPCIWINN